MTDDTPQSAEQPTKTHLCQDGVLRPGPGKYGKRDDRCRPCWKAYLKDLRVRKAIKEGRKPGVPRLNVDGAASTRHGFYRKKLDAAEAKLAEALHAEFRERYDLDSLADDMLLTTAVVNFVKSLRREPDANGKKTAEKDHNVRDYQSYYERNFKEALQALALTRKDRRDAGKQDDLAAQMNSLFRKKAEDAGFTEPPAPGP